MLPDELLYILGIKAPTSRPSLVGLGNFVSLNPSVLSDRFHGLLGVLPCFFEAPVVPFHSGTSLRVLSGLVGALI